MKIKIYLLLIALFFILITTTFSCAFLQYGANEEKLDYYFKYYSDKNLFGGSVLVAKNGEVFFNKGYNIAKAKDNTFFNKDTQTSIMSISKQITAVSILLLEEKGLLSTNDLASKYINGLSDGEALTIHHLLCMKSGLYNLINVINSEVYEGKRELKNVTFDEFINTLKNKPREYLPGEKYAYNNTNYYLLARIVEIVSGNSFRDFVNQNIFSPLGMKNTFQPDSYDEYSVLPDYFEANSYGNYKTKEMPHPSTVLGCGRIISTTGDLFLFSQALHRGNLLTQNSYSKMISPYSGLNSTDGYIFKTNYAYGLNIDNEITVNGKKRKTIWHSGSFANGVSTLMVHFIDENIDIIILENIRVYPSLEKHVIDAANIILK